MGLPGPVLLEDNRVARMDLDVVRKVSDELGRELVVVVVDPDRDRVAGIRRAGSYEQNQDNADYPNGFPDRSEMAPH